MVGEQVPGLGEGVGGGLVAGQEDGQHFVAKLPVAHAFACFLVADPEEHREQVAGILTIRAALFDDFVDDLVEPPYRSPEAQVGWRGYPLGYVE